MPSSSYERIYAVVARIPPGRVATYGQVARLAGLPGRARLVGYALRACNGDLPWQRVVNAQGTISPRVDDGGRQIQRILLEAEGVRFDGRGRIVLADYLWQP